ncbi:MAG: ammonium transporter [Opitutales bacterium]
MLLAALCMLLGTWTPAFAQPSADELADQAEETADDLAEAAGDALEAAEDFVPAEPDEAYLELKAKYGETFDFFTISTLWTVIAAALVFLMHLGFATLETGFTQQKNAVNILFKNVFIICMGLLAYAAYGFNAMYPGEFNDFFAVGSPLLEADYGDTDFSYGGTALCMTGWADFIFQAMFAATAATIVSGAVAERIKLPSFMLIATILVAFIYPITGSWQWGGGWLSDNGFHDFAGSSLVHAFGGFAALGVVLVLGPRKGKYTADGKIKPILGHSMPLGAVGVFLLFFGWFGFNGGSVLSADPEDVSKVFVTTALAAAAGGLASIVVAWGLVRKPDISMALNGILAGLVGITAGADSMGPWSAVIVGAIAGVIVVFSIIGFDKAKIDDPVGAISVHGVCGIWGTVAVGIFGTGKDFVWQIIGTLSISALALAAGLILAIAVKAIMGLRVDEDEEAQGLDVGEHGQEAYPDFQATTSH